MGIFDSLYIGNSGLNAAQIQIQTTGNNITNANNEFYTRQRVIQQAREGLHRAGGDIGLGTNVQQIVRMHDEYAYQKMTSSYSNLSDTGYKEQILTEITNRFPDLADSGIFQDLKDYYAAWNDYASNPAEASQKTVLLNATRILTNDINRAYNELDEIRSTVNDQFLLTIEEVNEIAKQISEINADLQRIEINTSVNGNDLRDKRDELELRLSKLTNIDSFKEDITSRTLYKDDATIYDMGRNYTLSINGITIVDGSNYHPIKLNTEFAEKGYAVPYYELNDESRIDISARFTSGKIAAMLDLRGRVPNNDGSFTDGLITKYQDNLDAFAKTLVTQTNSIYASSASAEMVSDYLKDVKDDTTLQNFDSGIKDGEFTVKVYNTQGKVVAQRNIAINAATTLNDITRGNSIVNDFNMNRDDNGDNNLTNDLDDYFKAVYAYDPISKTGNISFKPTDRHPSGYFIAIEDNGTNFAGTLGLSKFLDGQSAASIRPDDDINHDSALIKGGKSPLAGDNEMANDMVNMQNQRFYFNSLSTGESTETISGYYRYITTDIASDTASVKSQHVTNTAINNTSVQEWQSVSGVNIDEELSNLIKFQSSYGAAAKVITTVERMLQTLLDMKQ